MREPTKPPSSINRERDARPHSSSTVGKSTSSVNKASEMGGVSGTTNNIEKVNSTDAYSHVQESLEENKGQDKSATDAAQSQSTNQTGAAKPH